MKNVKSHEEFKQDVYDLVQDDYQILSEYKGAKEKILIKHRLCGREYEVRPSDFLRGSRCMACRRKGIETTATKQRVSEAVFKQRVKDLVRDEYQLIHHF